LLTICELRIHSSLRIDQLCTAQPAPAHASHALQIVSSLPLDTLEPLVRTYFGAIPSGGVPSPVQQVREWPRADMTSRMRLALRALAELFAAPLPAAHTTSAECRELRSIICRSGTNACVE
jgi:hypothetical protein